MDTGRPKRQHKAVEHFSSTAFDKSRPAAAPFSITAGRGSKLRDIENVEHRISLTRTTSPSLILLHRVLFPSHRAHPTKQVIKSHVRDFSGWSGDKEEEEARARLEKREVKDIRAVAAILDVSSSGSKKEIIDRILEFCQRPSSSGQAFKSKGKKRSSSGSGGGSAKKKAKTSSKGKGKKGGGGGGAGRSHNPYLLFVNERRQAGMGGLSVAEFGKKMGEEWRALDDDAKDEYKRKAADMKKEDGGDDDEEENGDEDGEEDDDDDEDEGEEGDEDGEEKDAGDDEADGDDKEDEEEEEDDGDKKGKKSSQKKQRKKQDKSDAGGEEEEEEEGGGEGGGEAEDGGVLEKLRSSISRIIGGGDLSSLSLKKVREQLTLEHGEELVSRFKDMVKKIVEEMTDKAKNVMQS